MIAKKWKWVSLVLLVSLVLSACNLSNQLIRRNEPTQTGEQTQETQVVKPTLQVEEVAGIENEPFARYSQVSYSIPDVFSGGYSLPLETASFSGLEEATLSESQVAALLANGFVVVPPSEDPNRMFMEFYQAYESYRYSSMPVFVTTDAIYHVYHLVFDKMLRDLETKAFIPILYELTDAMVEESASQYSDLKGT